MTEFEDDCDLEQYDEISEAQVYSALQMHAWENAYDRFKDVIGNVDLRSKANINRRRSLIEENTIEMQKYIDLASTGELLKEEKYGEVDENYIKGLCMMYNGMNEDSISNFKQIITQVDNAADPDEVKQAKLYKEFMENLLDVVD